MNGYEKSSQYLKFRRYCKVLKLNEDSELIEKYKELHRPGAVWPEITKGIREVGILDMEIYLHGNTAFMIMDTVPEFDHDKAMQQLAGLPRQKEWEQYVSVYQKAGDKSDTPEKWMMLERIFELDK